MRLFVILLNMNDSILNISTIPDKPKSSMEIFKSRKISWPSGITYTCYSGQSWKRIKWRIPLMTLKYKGYDTSNTQADRSV